jgi:LysM repeat protein
MTNRFKELGVPVTETRTTDVTLSPEDRVTKIMNAYGNNPNVIVISNHLNAGGGDGAEAIYALRDRDTLARIIMEEIAKEGQNVRKWYQRRLPDDTSKDYYFIHRNTGLTEPVIVEYGFVDNVTDANFIKSHWQDLAEAVVRGVATYKGIPYTVSPAEGEYIVKSGDTLWSIAKKFNVSVTELKTVNNLTTNSLSVGQRLTIPGYVAPSQSETTYVVQKGDSLWSIASAYNTTPQAIMDLNNLSSSSLSIGQQLKIPSSITTPEPIPTENTYTVQKGDSLWTIANKYGVTVTELRSLNNLTTDSLSIGQVLLIPIKTTTPTTPTTTPTNTVTYTVKSGDNLYSIAEQYGVSVTTIKNANNLTSNLLSVGQVLTIPVSGSQVKYTVKSGDSLWTIANKFGVTVNELRTANNLVTDSLSIGQVLVIP